MSTTTVCDDFPAVELVEKVLELKRERNAFILAHNFQSQEIQFVADYVGDALALSMEAGKVEQPVVMVCGPDFMVETTKILAPDKTVLYANKLARCPMAAMIAPKELRALKYAFPDAKVGWRKNKRTR